MDLQDVNISTTVVICAQNNLVTFAKLIIVSTDEVRDFTLKKFGLE